MHRLIRGAGDEWRQVGRRRESGRAFVRPHPKHLK